MVEFTESVNGNRLRALLDVALDGKGAFRRYKDHAGRRPRGRAIIRAPITGRRVQAMKRTPQRSQPTSSALPRALAAAEAAQVMGGATAIEYGLLVMAPPIPGRA